MYISNFKSFFIILLITCLLAPSLWAEENLSLITTESWSKHIVLDEPVIISPTPKLILSDNTEKVVVVPEKLDFSEEYQEFRLFRNRYVIFGVYIFTSLYYNWLTRNRR